MDLRYDLKFELKIVESVFEKDVAVLSLLETVRKQVIEEIEFYVSSVTVSGIGGCMDILTSETFTKLEKVNTTSDNIILYYSKKVLHHQIFTKFYKYHFFLSIPKLNFKFDTALEDSIQYRTQQ